MVAKPMQSSAICLVVKSGSFTLADIAMATPRAGVIWADPTWGVVAKDERKPPAITVPDRRKDAAGARDRRGGRDQ